MYAHTASGKRVFNTGKVLIGIRHEPPSHDQGISADRVQLALLLRARQTPRVEPIAKPLAWRAEDRLRHYWALWQMSRRFGNPFFRRPF